MTTFSHFTLYNARIDAHFVGPTGTVAAHANIVGLEAKARAIILAPKRTGYLASTVNTGTAPVGKLRYAITLGAYAPYAPFVISGTFSPITPFNHTFMKLQPGGGYGKFIYRQYVRGQSANNFLRLAMSQSLGAGGVAFLL